MNFTVAILLTIAIITEVAREICFKLAADRKVKHHRVYLVGLFGDYMTWLGFILWAVELVAWIMVLARIPLGIAFPFMSLCYAGVLLASKLILKEEVSKRKWAGVVLITIGVVVVGTTGI